MHHVAVHGPNSAGTGSSSVEGQTDAHADLGAGFHVYRVDWTKGSLTFSLDGAVVRTVTPSSLPKRTSWVFDHPFDLILDLAVGGTWPGDPDASTTWPQTMTVDYVRVSR